MAPLLLNALHRQANPEGLAEVTVAQLASTLNTTKRHVQRLLRVLETAGALTALRKAGGRGKPGQYIPPPKLPGRRFPLSRRGLGGRWERGPGGEDSLRHPPRPKQ